jgi:putative membrane protein
MKTNSILKTTAMLLLCLTVVTACAPSAKQDDSAEVAKDMNDATLTDRDDEKDADFLVNTLASTYAQIELSKLAITKSTDTGVKEMATMLEKDHTKILNELKAYGDKNGIAVPVAETDEASKDRNDLAAKDASDFDKKWCDEVADGHKKTINKLEARLDKTEDMELKNWISATLPGLRSHLEMIEQHEARVK